MPFQKGHEKFGGMKKGFSSKRWKRSIQEVLAKHDINLFEEILLDIPHMHPNKRNDVRLKLLEFVTPKLKALEVTGIPAQQTTVQIANIQQADRKALAAMLEDPGTLAAVKVIAEKLDSQHLPGIQSPLQEVDQSIDEVIGTEIEESANDEPESEPE